MDVTSALTAQLPGPDHAGARAVVRALLSALSAVDQRHATLTLGDAYRFIIDTQGIPELHMAAALYSDDDDGVVGGRDDFEPDDASACSEYSDDVPSLCPEADSAED